MMYDVYPGMEDELMEGAWETHGHVFPDYVPRCIDIIDYAIEASKAKMGGILCKDHFFSTVGQAWAAQWVVDEMVRKGELDYACKVLGTHTLAWSHHPDQINLIRKYPNLGAVFFSTMTAFPQVGPDMSLLDERSRLIPRARECVKLCAEYKIPIMTGHRVPKEAMALVRCANEYGAHILVTHATHCAGTIKQAREMGRLGAQLEINAHHGIPTYIITTVDPNFMPEWITSVGPEFCHINTDFGQPMTYDPVEGYRIFLRMLLHWGISKQDIKTMVHTNPEKYLYLQD
jgi:hypothetical protein